MNQACVLAVSLHIDPSARHGFFVLVHDPVMKQCTQNVEDWLGRRLSVGP